MTVWPLASQQALVQPWLQETNEEQSADELLVQNRLMFLEGPHLSLR